MNHDSDDERCNLCGSAFSEHDYNNPNMCQEGKNRVKKSEDMCEWCDSAVGEYRNSDPFLICTQCRQDAICEGDLEADAEER